MTRSSLPWLLLIGCALGALWLLTCADADHSGEDTLDICSEVECDDQNECTEDQCDAADPRVCVFTDKPESSPCEGGKICDGSGRCVACTRDEQCEIDDRNDCTVSECVFSTGACNELAPLVDGTACAGGECRSGACELSGSALPCTEQGLLNAVAAGGGPHTFDCSGPATIEIAGEIAIRNDVVLDGGGQLTVDGGGRHPLFHVAVGVTAGLHGIDLVNGVHGIGWNLGTLTLTNSTVSGHSKSGIRNFGQMTLTDSTISGNHSSESGGGISSGGELTVYRSTVSGNSAPLGGGVFVHSGLVTLVNSTVFANAARVAGGALYTNQALSLISSTVSANSSPSADGIFVNTYGWVEIANSLVDGSCDGDSGADIDVRSAGHNIESPLDSCNLDEPSDLANVSVEALMLGPLADNGGPTKTRAILPGSIAIDVIPEADCVDPDDEPLIEDQRGEPRPGGPICDVGAFEVQPAP